MEQRAAIGGMMILPALQGIKEQAAARAGLQLTDDDMVFATVWATVRYSVETTGGTAAIERLRDALDQIEATGAFGLGA